MKLLKALSWLTGLFLIVVIMGVTFLVFGVDPNDYKSQLSKFAKEKQITLVIEEDLSWSFFPNLVVNLGKSSISGQDIPSITFERIDFSLGWVELLTKTVSLKTITIHGADVIIREPKEAEKLPIILPLVPAEQPDASNSLDLPFELAISNLSIKDSKLTILFIDQKPIILENINLISKNISLENKEFSARLDFSGDFKLKKTTSLPISVNFNTKYLLEEDYLELTNLKGNSGPYSLGGNINLRDTLKYLQDGKGNAEINLDILSFDQIVVRNFNLNLFADNKVLKIKDLSGDIFDGNFHMTSRIDFNNKEPVIKFDTNINDLNIGKALSSLSELSDIEGILTADFKGSSQGGTQETLISNLDGEGSLESKNLKFGIFNLEKSYCNMAAIIEKRPLSQRVWSDYTELNLLQTIFSLNRQMLTIPRFTSGIGNLAISGNGKVNLKDQSYDLLFKANLKGDKTSPEGCPIKSKSIRNKDLPLRCKGSYEKNGGSICLPDQEFINQILKEKIKDKIFNSLLEATSGGAITNKSEDNDDDQSEDIKQQVIDTILKGLFK